MTGDALPHSNTRFPSPLWGGVRGGGNPEPLPFCNPPLPCPSPTRGREMHEPDDDRAHPHGRRAARRPAGAGGHAACRAGRVVSCRSRRDGVHRRRIRLRQDADRVGDHGSAARPRAAHGQAPGARRPRHAERLRARDVGHPRRARGHDLPGADDLAQPGLHHRQPARGSAAPAQTRIAPAGARARGVSAGARRHHGGGEPPQAVPAPALRRPAPARDDRHGADVRARA